MFSKLFGKKKASAETTQAPEAPAGHVVEVKWDNWSPAGPNDGKSSC